MIQNNNVDVVGRHTSRAAQRCVLQDQLLVAKRPDCDRMAWFKRMPAAAWAYFI